MGDWLTDYLWGLPWRAPEGLMFPADDETETPHSIGYTRKVIERGAKAIGLIHITPHRLRPTFATLHADAGTPVRRIQSMTRHKSILTLMRYIEDSEAGLREAQEIVAGRMRLAAPPKPKAKTAKVGKTGREVSKK